MPLKYKPFKNCQRIVNVVSSGKWLHVGEHSDGVMMLQGGLVALGANMPITMNSGSPDGGYGNETFRAVSDFQGSNECTVDGIAGVQTLTKMDDLLSVSLGPGLPGNSPGVPATPRPPILRDDNYILGTGDPTPTVDIGAGGWNSKSKEATYVALAGAIIRILPPFPESMATRMVTGPNAMAHMRHYFFGGGGNYTIDIESMIAATEKAKVRLSREVYQSKKFCETLALGTHNITSRQTDYSYNDKQDTTDWFFATGGYQSWGKGTVEITEDAAGVRQYDMDFEYKMFDRYNWDGGKSVTIMGITITDEFMAEFHRQGLAKEFNQYGTARRKVRWSHGDPIPPADVQTPIGGGR